MTPPSDPDRIDTDTDTDTGPAARAIAALQSDLPTTNGPLPADPTAPVAAPAVPTLADAPPGYVVEGELGGGGMGVVYLARQLGLNRPVALKLVRGGAKVDPKALIRFLAEAEAVAAVRHPNVVEVYSYGDHRGQPYLALEYCPGGDLTRLVSPTRERGSPSDAAHFRKIAELMAGVADGVNAAHAQGIVHRDLKPHNVFLAADGTPKVADFGLAKRGVGSDLTNTLAVLGTPAYMAPEQAGGGTKFVGPEADVWALGVMLYELLAGERPIPLDPATPLADALARVIQANVPPLKGKCPAVPPDLERIVHKCLIRDPRDRYPTAGGLAADLRNWLAGRPISARPPGAVEQAVKWARRNPRAAWGIAAVVAVLVGGTWVSTWQALRATREAERADAEAAEARKQAELAEANAGRADDEAVVARETKSFLTALVIASDPTGLSGTGLLPAGEGGTRVTVGELIDRGVALVGRDERFRGAERGRRLLRASLCDDLGEISRALGRFAQAEPLLREAVAIRRELLPADDPDRLVGEFHLARWYTETGDVLNADALFTALLDVHRRGGTHDTLAAADVRIHFSLLLTQLEDPRGEEQARLALATRERRLGTDHRDTHVARMTLAAALFGQGKGTDGMAVVLPAISALGKSGAGKDPLFTAILETQSGMEFRARGLHSLAVRQLRSADGRVVEHLGPVHPYRVLVLAELATALESAGDPTAAEETYRSAVDITRRTAGLGHPQALNLLNRYTDLLLDQGRKDEAWALAEEVLCTCTGRFGPDVPWRLRLVSACGRLAARTGRFAVAGGLADEAVALARTPGELADRKDLSNVANFAEYLDDLPDPTAFDRLYAVLLAHPRLPDDPQAKWFIAGNYGAGLVRLRRYKEADPHLRDAIPLGDDPQVKGKTADGHRAYLRMMAGKAAWANGRWANAADLFRTSAKEQELLGKKGNTDPLDRWLVLAVSRGKADDAVEVAGRLAKFAPADPADRAWATATRAALASTDAARTELAAAVEKQFGASADVAVVIHRGRAVVAAGGDAGREAGRLDAILTKGKPTDAVQVVRAECALAAGKPDEAAKVLAGISVPLTDSSQSHLRRLLTAVAAHRGQPSEQTLEVVRACAKESRRRLEKAAVQTDPELPRWEAGDLTALRWWCERAEAEAK